jgi:hypothetical protein
MGFTLFLLFVLFLCRSVGFGPWGLVQYIEWSSGCRSIQSTLHFTHLRPTATSHPSVSSFVRRLLSTQAGPFLHDGMSHGRCLLRWGSAHGRNQVADSRAYTGPRTDSYTETSDFSGKDTHLPSLPGSTALSCAPSGSSPRLSATRATPSRIARYHGHESVTLAE